NPYARGDHVRPRIVQATVIEPRIPWIYPWGASIILSHILKSFQVRAFQIRLKGHAVFPVIGVNALLHQFRQLLYS
ncbi:MAG: hypothetical protein Q4B72_13125, partial [Lachnospiraceae bacterium]|nr:hypothetical protein [Lachnospiraceae bacterium]